MSKKKQDIKLYKESLLGEELKRYEEKIVLCKNVDPYTLDLDSTHEVPSLYPRITYGHLYNYIVFTKSYATQNQMMNFTSLNCYNNFTSGLVQAIRVLKLGDDLRLIVAQVTIKSLRPYGPYLILS